LHDDPAIYVPLTLLAALGFAAAAVLQQREAASQPRAGAVPASLLLELSRRPLWLAGMLAYLIAYALQVFAVSLGPVVVIQPLISAQLVFALVLGVLFAHQRAGLRDWLGALGVACGIAVFIVATDPSPGDPSAASLGWIVAGGGVAALVALCVLRGWRSRGPAGSTWYGAASGFAWGMMIVLMKTVTHGLSEGESLGAGAGRMFGEPYLYALLLCAIAGFLFLQTAFQAGSLTNALVTYTVVEIVVAVALGILLFGEKPHDSPLSLLLTAASSLVMLAGIVALARSPAVAGPAAPSG